MAPTAKTKYKPAAEPAPATNVTEADAHAANRAPRAGSNLASVVSLLESAAGATVAEITAATGWQQHTVRGALAGSITRKFGRTLTSEKIESRGHVYRIALQA
jgi:hypothetical protein